MNEPKYIVVIGASAGGFKLVSELVSKLSAGIDAAVFVVMHLSKNSDAEVIRSYLQRNISLECSVAQDGQTIKSGVVYIAVPDKHLMVNVGTVAVLQGPYENRWRPAIDVLFRTAAAAYNSRVIGVVLSGLLDDGTSGMYAIKRCGGVCIVQEPGEAIFPDMPKNVLNNVDVDYRGSVSDIAYIIQDLVSKPVPPPVDIPEEIRVEAEITKRMSSNISDLDKIGEQTHLTCPDCGGNLWKLKEGESNRYRCFTGHSFDEKVLSEKQQENLEESLWVSVRMLEERRNLLRLSAGYNENQQQANGMEERAQELEKHIKQLKSLLISVNNSETKKLA
jgi:two-component system chemotaxis response regulator CheB